MVVIRRRSRCWPRCLTGPAGPLALYVAVGGFLALAYPLFARPRRGFRDLRVRRRRRHPADRMQQFSAAPCAVRVVSDEGARVGNGLLLCALQTRSLRRHRAADRDCTAGCARLDWAIASYVMAICLVSLLVFRTMPEQAARPRTAGLIGTAPGRTRWRVRDPPPSHCSSPAGRHRRSVVRALHRSCKLQQMPVHQGSRPGGGGKGHAQSRVSDLCLPPPTPNTRRIRRGNRQVNPLVSLEARQKHRRSSPGAWYPSRSLPERQGCGERRSGRTEDCGQVKVGICSAPATR